MQGKDIKIDLSKKSLNAIWANNLEFKLISAEIIPGNIPPLPETVLSYSEGINEMPILTRGSLSMIIGKAKGGKTGLTILFVSAVLKGFIEHDFEDNTGFTSNADGVVIVIDTEQGSYYAALTASRIKKLAGNSCDRLRYYDLRRYSPKERIDLIKAAIQKEKNISLIVIDGLKDLVYDINDAKESTEIVTELMRISEIYNCHITVILHQNKGDLNARGHVGTEGINKSETVFSVNKDDKLDWISHVKADYTRGPAFEPFAIGRTDDGTPYLTNSHQQKNKITINKRSPNPGEIEVDIHTRIASGIFKTEDAYSYANLISNIKLEFAKENIVIGDNKARDFKTHWLNTGIINHNGKDGKASKYTLNHVKK